MKIDWSRCKTTSSTNRWFILVNLAGARKDMKALVSNFIRFQQLHHIFDRPCLFHILTLSGHISNNLLLSFTTKGNQSHT